MVPGGEQLAQLLPLRMVAVGQCLLDVSAAAVPRRDQLVDALDGHAQRLLAEHVLAGLERTHRPRHVQRVRQRHVDRVDVRIGQQVVVACVTPWDAELLRDRAGLLLVAGRDGQQRRAGGLVHRRNHPLRGDVRRTEHPPVHRSRHLGSIEWRDGPGSVAGGWLPPSDGRPCRPAPVPVCRASHGRGGREVRIGAQRMAARHSSGPLSFGLLKTEILVDRQADLSEFSTGPQTRDGPRRPRRPAPVPRPR